MLSTQQLAHFETFGFLLLRQVFPSAEMAEIIAAAENHWQEALQSQADAAKEVHPTRFVEKRPLLARLVEDDRIYLPIQQLLVPGMQKETGTLRVLPGSHRLPFHRDLEEGLHPSQGRTSRKAFGVDGADLPCFPLEVTPGDVVVFNHYLFHGVYGEQNKRRYIAMKFADAPQTQEHYEALRAHGQDASCLATEFRHSERPRIKGMVEKLLEWEEKLTE